MFRDAASGSPTRPAEKRASLDARIAKTAEIVAAAPDDHFLLWHDLEDERRAIDGRGPRTRSPCGARQDLDERERRITGFSDGEIRILPTKPVIAGAGCNFQRTATGRCSPASASSSTTSSRPSTASTASCKTSRSGSTSSTPRPSGASATQLERKWREHDELVARMGEIIRELRPGPRGHGRRPDPVDRASSGTRSAATASCWSTTTPLKNAPRWRDGQRRT